MKNISYLYLLLVVSLSGCSGDTDVTAQRSGRLVPGGKYILTSPVFFREYEGVLSLHPPGTPWSPDSLDSYRTNAVSYPYIKGIVTQGNTISFVKVVHSDLRTHDVTLYYGRLESGTHKGKNLVLITDLIGNDMAPGVNRVDVSLLEPAPKEHANK